MGKFHHSKKAHSAERGKSSSKQKYDVLKSDRKKLPDDFRLAEEDLGEILDEDEVKRIKTAPTIPPMLLFEPANLGDVETKEEPRA
eukprot:gene37405-48919_t